MIRPIFTELALFITPFVLYAIFLWATKSEILHPEHWPVSRIFTLTAVALSAVRRANDQRTLPEVERAVLLERCHAAQQGPVRHRFG